MTHHETVVVIANFRKLRTQLERASTFHGAATLSPLLSLINFYVLKARRPCKSES